MTVKEFKKKVSDRVNVQEFSLIFAGKPLVDEKPLRFYHEEHCLCNGSTVFLCRLLVESPMWTLFVKLGDGSTASVIERREVFMVSCACIDKLSNYSFLRSCHYICHLSKPNRINGFQLNYQGV